MKHTAQIFLAISLLFSCSVSKPGGKANMDRHPEQATVEDYILALPPYQVHEEKTESYRKDVLAARSAP